MKEVQPIRNMEKIQEIKKRLAQNGTRDVLLFSMGINTGLRISDLLSLKVGDVRGKREYVLKEKKTGKTKRILLHAVMKDIGDYTAYKTDNEYLFSSRKGIGPIDRVQAYRILNKAAKDCGLEEIGTHTLRKTFGYHFYKANQNVAMLQQLFNHSSPVFIIFLQYSPPLVEEKSATAPRKALFHHFSSIQPPLVEEFSAKDDIKENVWYNAIIKF